MIVNVSTKKNTLYFTAIKILVDAVLVPKSELGIVCPLIP